MRSRVVGLSLRLVRVHLRHLWSKGHEDHADAHHGDLHPPTQGRDGLRGRGVQAGRMMFDINVLFNPPHNFVEVPRPVLVNFAPIFFVRNHDAS